MPPFDVGCFDYTTFGLFSQEVHSILHVDLLSAHQWISNQAVTVKLSMMQMDCVDPMVVISGVVIDSAIEIAAGGVPCEF